MWVDEFRTGNGSDRVCPQGHGLASATSTRSLSLPVLVLLLVTGLVQHYQREER